MKSVAVLINTGRKSAVALARDLVPWLGRHGLQVMLEYDGAEALDAMKLARDEDALTETDFALVMGGDGTLLRANRIMAPAEVPMLALHLGQFGFMTDVEPEDAVPALEKVLAGDYVIHERLTLKTRVVRPGSRIKTPVALNDVVISKGPLARMLKMEMNVSGRFVSNYLADGLIIATPTGSTAYSLSAGGPLIAPELKLITITPICPHTLSTRSLVVSSRESIETVVESKSGDVVMLTVDGQVGIPLEHGDRVVVTESKIKARLISVEEGTFYKKLQTRLRWGDRFDCLENRE